MAPPDLAGGAISLVRYSEDPETVVLFRQDHR